jgi:kynurenine formamidase
MSDRWKVRPERSNWGDFGADDEVGRLNLITPERRLAAVREVKEGLAFCLSLPLDLPGGNALVTQRFPPVRGVQPREKGTHFVNFPMSIQNPHWDDIVSDDYVKLYTQYSTQWDALSHVGREFDADDDGSDELVYYNGFLAGSDIVGTESPEGPTAHRLGIEKMAETCVQGRGVLVDIHAHFGDEHRMISYDDFQGILDADNIVIETGDMLCVHTGFGQAIIDMAGRPDPDVLHNKYAMLDGRDERLLGWIEDSGISVLVADNHSVECFPYVDRTDSTHYHGLPIHQRCLVDLGIHLGELWYFTELAKNLAQRGRSRFLLTAPPLRLPGSFGSPATPVATI